ncbi:hypothetical protein GCM10010498_44430 [Streptomyces cavourensis]|nr:hypothetical protein GCM10010498_44430 [Streptomyces cavourensis]
MRVLPGAGTCAGRERERVAGGGWRVTVIRWEVGPVRPGHRDHPASRPQAAVSSAAPKETLKRAHQILTLVNRFRSISSGRA